MLTTERLTPEQQDALQKEKLLLLSRAVVGPPLERAAALQRLRAVHHLSDTQIVSQIGPTSTLCRLEENQTLLLQLSKAVQKLAQTPPTQDAAARLEENQAILLQLSTAVSKLALAPVESAPMAQLPVAVDAEAEAFRKSWLFRLWRFFYRGKS
jgi:hypothetical protein